MFASPSSRIREADFGTSHTRQRLLSNPCQSKVPNDDRPRTIRSSLGMMSASNILVRQGRSSVDVSLRVSNPGRAASNMQLKMAANS